MNIDDNQNVSISLDVQGNNYYLKAMVIKMYKVNNAVALGIYVRYRYRNKSFSIFVDEVRDLRRAYGLDDNVHLLFDPQQVGLSFRTTISNFMSGRERNEINYRKTCITPRRRPVIRTWKVQNTQHSRKEPFTNAWNMPKQPCDGMRSSCVGLNNVDLRCLRHPSRKAVVFRTPHPIISGAQSDGTLWLSSGRLGCRNPRQRVKTYGHGRPRLQYPSLSP